MNSPQLWEKVERVYKELALRAEDEDGRLIYTGGHTKLIAEELGMGQSYVTHTISTLKKMDCIRVMLRGNRYYPGKIELLEAPTEAKFHERPYSTQPSRSGLVQRDYALFERIGKVERANELLEAEVEILKAEVDELKRRLDK